jgi:hypothetical protein
MIMNNGQGRLWKEAAVACWSSIILEGQRKVTKSVVKITGILVCV